jgi:hypothetical protein
MRTLFAAKGQRKTEALRQYSFEPSISYAAVDSVENEDSEGADRAVIDSENYD